MDDLLGSVFPQDEGRYLFVFVAPTNTFMDAVDTLVHEAVHVLQHALLYAQEETIGDEASAYSTASIVRHLLTDYIEREGDFGCRL